MLVDNLPFAIGVVVMFVVFIAALYWAWQRAH